MKNGKESSSEEEESLEQESQKSEEKKEKNLLDKKREREKEKEKSKEKSKEKEKEKDKKSKNKDIIVEENEVKFILDNKKRITVHKFKGQIKVDIREFYDSNGEMRPGKKGISLSLDNWEKLKGFIDNIDDSIDNIK